MSFIEPQSRKTFGNVLGFEVIDVTSAPVAEERPFLLQEWLFEKQVSLLAGPPNIGKSAIVAYFASHIACGAPLGPFSVSQANIVYVAAEDAQGIIERVQPHTDNLCTENAAFGLIEASIDLSNPEEIQRLTHDMHIVAKDLPHDKTLFVIDTLNLCIGMSDENVAAAMSQVMKSARTLATEFGGHTMIIHHVAAANKNNDDSRPRGSTTLEANADTVIMLEQVGDHVVFRCKKQRSGPKPEPLRFQVQSYVRESFVKTTGGKMRSLPKAVLLEGDDNSIAANAESVKKSGSKAQKDDAQLRVEEVLRLMRRAAEVDENLTKTELKSLLSDTFDSNAPSSDGRRKTLDRVLDSMIAAGLISIGPGKRYELLR